MINTTIFIHPMRYILTNANINKITKIISSRNAKYYHFVWYVDYCTIPIVKVVFVANIAIVKVVCS
jgi:hypothetical protein